MNVKSDIHKPINKDSGYSNYAYLYGLDFGPYTIGNPNYGDVVTPEHITKLIETISPYTQWVRTYGTTHGLENVPEIAGGKGLKVACGCWLSGDETANETEINGLIQLAQAGKVDLAIVGSETLLRNDLNEEQLIGYIERVKATGVTTATADTYNKLLEHPNVVSKCDLVFANIFPFWEGVSIDKAISSLDTSYKKLLQAYPGMEVIISETGWPSAGESYVGAVPSLENGRFYLENFLAWAGSNNVKYFCFEAFDEPWKALYEGERGAHWGLWDKDGIYKYSAYTITASALPPQGGTITGAGSYPYNQAVTLKASANPGFHFVNWTEGTTEVSRNAEYSFPATRDRNLTANFALDQTGNTPSGNNVEVNLGGGVKIVFDLVLQAGNTTATPRQDPSVPSFSILGGSCFDIVTTASFSGKVEINLPYDESDISVPEPDLRLLHREGASWVDITVAVDTLDNVVKGEVSSLSDFCIAWTQVEPTAKTLFYFAEGYTGTNFQEYLCLGNPGDSPAHATITYMFPGGGTQQEGVTIPPNSRSTVNVNASVGAGQEVSAKVESDQAIIAERPMYFAYNGAWSGGHDAVGATAPSQQWYFAEGYTGPGFDEYICVLNPGDTPANLTFYFQTQEEGEKVVGRLSLDPHSRRTFRANDILGPNYQTSLKLSSDQPVVAERPIYFSYSGSTGSRGWAGGHCVMGVPELAKQYYFAEGTTRGGFEEWLTLQNPNPHPIVVDATYQLGPGQGDPVQRSYEVPPGGRKTVYVPDPQDGVGTEKDVSVYLSSASDFLAERPTYFGYSYGGLAASGGHCVIGSPGTAPEWFFAEGYTGDGFNQWLCLQNPGSSDSTVEITYYTQGAGALPIKAETISPGTRKTLMVNEHAGQNYQLSTRVKVISGPAVVAERPMYFIYSGWDGGHDVVGYAP